MRCSSVFAAIISTAACSPPAESPVVARVEALPARSANAAAPPAPARAKPLLSPLSAPSAELCAFSDTVGELDLRLRPDGPPVVAVHVTPARIVLPDAPGTSAWVDVRRPEIRVAAWASGKDLPFYASRPTVFARWWSPKPSQELAWRTEGKGILRLFAKAPYGIRPLTPLERTADCSGISSSVASFDPKEAFGLGARSSRAMLRESPPKILLYARSDGEPVAALSGDYLKPVEVYGAENGRIRVAFSIYEGFAVGWVNAADVLAPPPRLGGAHSARPPIVRRDPEEPIGELWTCRADVPLGLVSGEERVIIGAAPAGTTIQVDWRERGVALVRLPDAAAWVHAVGAASFVVLESNLSEPGCRVRHVAPE